MFYKKNLFIFALFLLLSLFFVQSTSAQGLVPCGNGNNASNACTLCHFIVGIYNLVDFGLKLLVVVAAVGIFISGVMYIMAAGSEKTITSAKSFLSSSLIGFSVVLGAWFIISTVMWVFSVRSDLGIGKASWNTSGGKIEFACSTASSSVSSGAASSGQVSNSTNCSPAATDNCACFSSNGGDQIGKKTTAKTNEECRQECLKKSESYYGFNLCPGQPMSAVNAIYCNCGGDQGFIGKSISVLDVSSCDQECANRKAKYYYLGAALSEKKYNVTKTANAASVVSAAPANAKTIPCNCLDSNKKIVGAEVYTVSGDACNQECANRKAVSYRIYNGFLFEKTYPVSKTAQ